MVSRIARFDGWLTLELATDLRGRPIKGYSHLQLGIRFGRRS
jgi:hypothetical protein